MTRAPFYIDDTVTLWHGDALSVLADLPDESVNCLVTSPPYFQLRNYDEDGQIGQEDTPAEFVARLTDVFREARRVLAKDGTCWVNIGDSYSVRWGSARRTGRRGFAHDAPRGRTGTIRHDVPEKNLLGIPWRLALSLQDDGWYLRNDIIWNAPNKMPEAVTDRFTNRYEHVFLLSKSRRYWFDLDPVRVPHVSPTSGRAATFGRTTKEADVPGQGARQHRAGRAEDAAHHPNGRNPGDYWLIDQDELTYPPQFLSTDEAVYIAAFIDGEGSICARRRKNQTQLILTVVNTNEAIIRWLHERTGMGQVTARPVRNEKWRPCFEWNVTSRQAAQVLWAVYPYLRVKQQQAAVALNFMSHTRLGGGPAPERYHVVRAEMADDLSALNHGLITRSEYAVEPQEPPTSSAGDVWVLPTQPFPGAHFAVMPVALAQRCIVAGCKPGGVVLDPFSGSGTTGLAAAQVGRRYVGIDLNREYLRLSLETRLAQGALILGDDAA